MFIISSYSFIVNHFSSKIIKKLQIIIWFNITLFIIHSISLFIPNVLILKHKIKSPFENGLLDYSHIDIIALAKIFALRMKFSSNINSSAPCILLFSPGNAAPNATPPVVL